MNQESLISIIIPVYNASATLERCVNSLRNQDYINLEIIVIDDGSRDESKELCDYLAEQDDRICVYHKKNGGVSSARNLGILKAKGDYICFVDADDFVNSDHISSLYKNMQMGGWSVCGVHKVGGECINSHIKVKKVTRDEAMISVLTVSEVGIHGYPVNKMFDSNIIKQNNINFNEHITMCEDLLFCVQYLSCIEAPIVVSSNASYNYDVSSNGAVYSQYHKQKIFNPHRLTEVFALLKCRKFLGESRPVYDAWRFKFLQSAGNTLRVMVSNGVIEQYRHLYRVLLGVIRHNLWFGLKRPGGRRAIKLSILLLALSPKIEYLAWGGWHYGHIFKRNFMR